MTDFIKTWAMWILAAALVAALGLAGVQTVRLANTETEFANHKTAVADVNAQRERDRATDEASARRTEKLLIAEAEQAKEEKREAIALANARADRLADELRKRPTRPAAPEGSATGVAGPGPGGTGAGLYREDGLFLVGEAASAAQVGIERDSCRRQYDGARELLRKYGLEGEVK